MSQKKVDAYKERKANREKIMKKEKRMLLLEKAAALAVCLLAVAWIGISVYNKAADETNVPVQETQIDTSALDAYVSGLAGNAE